MIIYIFLYFIIKFFTKNKICIGRICSSWREKILLLLVFWKTLLLLPKWRIYCVKKVRSEISRWLTKSWLQMMLKRSSKFLCATWLQKGYMVLDVLQYSSTFTVRSCYWNLVNENMKNHSAMREYINFVGELVKASYPQLRN